MKGHIMFIEVGEGWHVNLAHVAKIHVVDAGGAGTVLKFYSAMNNHLGDFVPETPDGLMQVLSQIESFGKVRTNIG
jgi:hypothetical protein